MNDQQADAIFKTFPRAKQKVHLIESDGAFRDYLSRIYDNREGYSPKDYTDKLKKFLQQYVLSNGVTAESKFWASKILYAMEAGSDFEGIIQQITLKGTPMKFFDIIKNVKTAKLNEVI